MADQVIMLMQEMRRVEDNLALMILHEVSDEITAADADKIVPHIKGSKYARLVAATLNVGVEIELDRFFQPTRNERLLAPAILALRRWYMPTCHS